MQRVIVLAITIITATAVAHVAPSVDDNNRYVKITPAADRIRIAYTVFFGEVPGAQLRPSLDTNGDATISEGEAAAFGEKLAAQVGDSLELAVDGQAQKVAWTTISVGMGAPGVRAGSFSVDLVAWACLATPRGEHTLQLHDRFRVPKPGETEVRVEDGLGITVQRARVGPHESPTRDFKFMGPGGALSDDGLDVAFVASDKAPLGDAACTAGRRAASGGARTTGPWLWVIAGAIVLGVPCALWARRRARRART